MLDWAVTHKLYSVEILNQRIANGEIGDIVRALRDDGLDEFTRDVETERVGLALVPTHLAVREVDQDRQITGVDQHVGAHLGAQRRRHLE